MGTKQTLSAALALGFSSGCLEVALRAEPRLGLSAAEAATWLALAVGCGLAVALPAGLIGAAVDRRTGRRLGVGLVAAALLALHAGLWYRFEIVLNDFVRSPRVWGGLLGIAALSLVAGLALDRLLRRLAGVLWVAGALAAAAALALSRPPPAAAAAGPSVLLITLDTTRPDRLGPYGGPAQTPTLDRLAAEGVTFDQVIAPAPLTEPSHLAIMSGKPVHATGVVSNGTDFAASHPELLPDMLQRRFQEAGYRTGGFVSGFPLHGKWGWWHGFDVYDDDFGTVPGLHRLSLVRLYEQLFLPGNTLRERHGQHTAARTLSFLEGTGGQSFFVWMHLFDPHAPYEVSEEELAAAPRDGEPLDLPQYLPPPYRNVTDVDWIIDSYDREISKADRLVGEVLDQLEASGRLDDTLVIVTADHGESLTEHGYLFDHGDYLYDASLRVPLIVRYPPAVRAGLRVGCQTATTEILPTVVDMLGLRALDGERARSLAGVLAGEPCENMPVISATVAGRYMEDPPVDRSLRSATEELTTKLIVHSEGREDEGYAFFDLRADPGEERDLAGSRPEEVRAVRGLLGSMLEGNTVDVASPETDAGTMEALEALGYIE